MAKNKKKPAKKTPVKAKAKAKAKPAAKKAAKKPTTRKAAKKVAKKPAAKKSVKKAVKKTTQKTVKQHSAAAPKVAQKKQVAMTAPAPDKKIAKPFMDEGPQKSLSSQPILKEADLDEELVEDDVDIAVEADEDVEEELTLDGEDEDTDFPEKREGLLDDTDDYHTH
jgi:hypothetical protein